LPNDIGRRNPAAGNGIFGCGDGRLKSAEETASVTGDRKGGTIPAKIPTETAYPESAQGFAVSEDWMVVWAVRYEPVSEGFTCYWGKKGEIRPGISSLRRILV
jgi:hypothetical protein